MTKAGTIGTVRSKDAGTDTAVRAQAAQFGSKIQRLATPIICVLLLTGFASAAPRSHAPDFAAVAHAVESYIASLADYQPGDLITRSQIERALDVDEVKAAGLPEAEIKRITDLGLADDSFLIRELSTAAGRKFMRKTARHPGTYARLDRLSTIPRGQTLVHDLIRDKGGDKLIEYLSTTKGGQKMGGMMAGVRGGADLNKPTGRIYTADDLVAELKAALAKATP